MDSYVQAIPELLVTASDPVVGDTDLLGRESPVTEVIPPSPTKQPISLKSNLHKKGKRFKGWHQRYFEIQGKHMYYYKNHTKKDCLGEIDLSMCVYCDMTDEATFGAPFEIQTTVRTHVMSARSNAERDQWIQAIQAQMGIESEKKPTVNKPKRWKTFRNAFKIPQRQKASAASSKVSKRKSIMDRFKLRRSNAPPPLRISTKEPPFPHRPMSLVDDEIPRDTLAALEDVVPSRSLPATPLARKITDPLLFSPPESPKFTDPETPLLTPDSPATAVTIPVEINYVPVSGGAAEGNHDDEGQKEISSHYVPEAVVKFQERLFIWDQIRESLESDDCPHDMSYYDVLPKEDQEWMEHTSGVEQLRAFLAVCD